jgi:hypothetical protein
MTERDKHAILRPMVRLLSITGLGSLVILVALPLAVRFRFSGTVLSLNERLSAGGFWSATFLAEGALLAGSAAVFAAALYYFLRRLEPSLDAHAVEQAFFLDRLDAKYVDLSIVLAAALSLFLELAIIRWQSSVLEFLAFYKNFSLLSCFAGLGLGYALARRTRIPLLLVIPLLAWQFGFMMITRLVPSLFHVIPFREQLTMGFHLTDLPRTIVLYFLLAVLFLMTALTFLPVGQLCGRLMERRTQLHAYGLNLLGSLVGVLLMMLASYLWTPPLVWFALCFLGLLVFQSRRTSVLTGGLIFAMVCTIILSWWPVDRSWNRIYSPYQLLEIGPSEDTGLTLIRAAGHYYQRIYDFSGQNLSPSLRKIRSYYDFPYKAVAALQEVAIVGAGSGNDVAAALRAGSGRVDAIEIDPAIMLVGRTSHPEKPYTNLRTRVFSDDARSFLRSSRDQYDLIVYGLLDSHTLLSQGSSVRLDSFVYTLEGLREARNRLKPGGAISLSFSVLSDTLGRKIYLMLQQTFDGRPPFCVSSDYDASIIFLESNDPNWRLSPTLIADSGFTDQTALFGNPSIPANVSTDDWPFFYMPQRVYPASYLVMILQILLLSLVLFGSFLSVGRDGVQLSQIPFFFLGVGFMLIETKGITEMGLTFGNTWQVIGIVIAGILVMGFLGNWLVLLLHVRRSSVPFLFLGAALTIGWYIARTGGFASTPVGRLETAVMLTCPLLFAGIVFSASLSGRGQVSGILAINLLGAIVGGLLEYNSMYLGFRWLYLAAMINYLLAFVSVIVFPARNVNQTSSVVAGA